jgi:5-methylcytosine-specific restriction endonuclease McrA
MLFNTKLGLFRKVDFALKERKMALKKESSTNAELSKVIDEVRRNRERRENSYREKAFKLFPKICAHCGREFSGKKLRELTVHHKDHNHNNNPPDGSNWELLCIYCHDNEHSRQQVAEAYKDSDSAKEGDPVSSSGFNTPFADLVKLLKK